MSRISDVLDQYAERFPDCDWRFRAGRMAEEILGLRDQLLRSSDDSHTGSRIKPDLSATAYKAEAQDESAKAVTITRSDYARACDEADKDMHRVGVAGTFFERVCRHLGLDAQDECACGGIAPFHYDKCPNKQKTQNDNTPFGCLACGRLSAEQGLFLLCPKHKADSQNFCPTCGDEMYKTPSGLLQSVRRHDVQRELYKNGFNRNKPCGFCGGPADSQQACAHFAYWKREGRCLECQADDRETLAQPAEGYEPACGRCLARTEKTCTCLTPAENE